MPAAVKALSPGLRLGFMVADPDLIDEARAEGQRSQRARWCMPAAVKALSPGLRLGFMVADPDLIDEARA
ncbi:hypothetical protein C0U41_29560, partial [Klebsiella pneumoniae]